MMLGAERWVGGLVIVLLVSGCYRSVPLETSTPPDSSIVSLP